MTRKTRSQARSKSLSDSDMEDSASTEISDGVKKYLAELLHSSTLELKNEIDELKSLINNKNEQIAELNEKVIHVVQRNIELAGELKEVRHDFEIKIDDLEQYGRKNSLRIEGIEVCENESNTQLTKKVAEVLNVMGANITPNDFFRLHRSGRPHMRNGKRVAQTIVRFKSWSARSRAYQTRYTGTKEERESRDQFVRLDLTKRRLALLSSAQTLLDKHLFAHAYADSECSLLIMNRTTKNKYRFNSEYELHDALSMIEKE